MTRHGLPAAKTPVGMSRVTTLPAPMTVRSPMVTPGQMIAPPPTHTSAPIVTGLPNSCLRRSSAFHRVGRGVDLHRGAEEREVADGDAADVEHDAVEVEVDALAEMDVRAVIAVERRLHPDCVAARAEEVREDAAAQVGVAFGGGIEVAAEVAGALAKARRAPDRLDRTAPPRASSLVRSASEHFIRLRAATCPGR